MRFIDRNPGAAAGEAGEAARMVSSNLSRALRSLEKRGLVRREADADDARRVRLFPTELARGNVALLRDLWSGMLDGLIEDPRDIEQAIATLRRLEAGLVEKQPT